ncbi:MAG TPA: TolC family protein [Bdellovibrionales bacterium]|nr:TolC family protein [Bdellovibrionales bacterium]
MEEAAQANDELRAQSEVERAARYEANQAYAGFLPSLTATAGLNYGASTEGDPSLARGGVYGKVVLNQSLFSGLADVGRLEKAQANLRSMRAKLALTKAKVSFDLKQAYSALLYAQRSLVLQEEIIRRRQKNHRIVELRFKSGRENRGSVLMSDANSKQAALDLLQAKNAVSIARAELSQVLGRDADVPVTVKEDIPLSPLPPPPEFQKLVVDTPDYADYVAAEDSARSDVKIARAGFLPSIGVEALAENTGEHWFPEQKEKWNIGASISFPIFNGGRDWNGIRRASAGLNAATSRRENVTRQLLAKLKVNYMAYQQNLEKLKVDESYREALFKRAEIARSKYNNGLMTFEDWDIIEGELISREKAVLLTQRDLARSESTWQQAQGFGVIP